MKELHRSSREPQSICQLEDKAVAIHIPPGQFQVSNVYGRMQIFGVGSDFNVYTKWKNTIDPNSSWSNWENLGGATRGIADDSDVTIGYLPDGRMQIFCAGNDGFLWSRWKITTDANSPWSDWAKLGGAGNISVGYLPDQRMQIFNPGGKLHSSWKTTTDPDSPWSDWASMAVPEGGLSDDILVGYLPDQRMQIFSPGPSAGPGTPASLYSSWKLSPDPDSGWSDWVSMGQFPGKQNYLTSPPTIGYLPDARMQLFVIPADQNLYSRWKGTTDPDSYWTDWANMGRPQGTYLNNVSVGYVSDARMLLLATDNVGTVHSISKTSRDPNAGWGNWESLGSPADSAEWTVVGYLTDNRMQIFAPSMYYSLYSKWKIDSSSWSGWGSMGAGPTGPGGGLPNGVSVGYLPYEGP